MQRSTQLNLHTVWRQALLGIGSLILFTLILQFISTAVPQAAGMINTVIIGIKFLTAAALLGGWALVNIPPPKPAQGRMVLGISSFAEVSTSGGGSVHPPRRTLLHLIRPRLRWEPTVNEEGRTLVPLPFDGYDMGDFTAQRLERLFAPISDLVVAGLPYVGSREEARSYGRERNADLVIWGATTPRRSDQSELRFWPRCTFTRPLEPTIADSDYLLAAPRSFVLGPRTLSVRGDHYVGITPFFSFISGLAYYTCGDPEGAADEFGAALIGDIMAAGAEPDEPAHVAAQALTLLFLGNARFLQGSYSAAEQAYRDALELRPQFGEARCNLGLLRARQGDNVAALDLLAEAIAVASDQPLIHYNYAILLRQLGRVDQALASLRTATGLDASFAEAQRLLAVLLRAQGETDEAFVALREALAHKPAFAAAYRDLAALYVEREMYDKAEEELVRALKIDPNHAESYYELGLLRERQGRGEEAIDALQEAISLRPDFGEAHHALGVVYRNEGRLDLALGQFSEASAIIDSAETHLSLGLAFQAEGRQAEAEKEFRQALAMEPDSAEAHLALARLLRERGEFDPARVALRQAMTLRPQMFEAFLELAELRRAQGDLARAAQTIEQLVAGAGKSSPEAWQQLGSLYVARAREDRAASQPLLGRAIEAYGHAVALQPGDARAIYNMASAYLLAGDRFTAVERLGQALQIAPDDGLAWELLGITRRDLRQFAEASTALRRAVQLRPAEIGPRLHLATTLRAQGQLDEAIGELHAAMRIEPGNMRLLAQLGEVYMAAHRFDRAAQILGRAVQLAPERADLHVALGNAYRSAGRHDEALAALSTAVRLNPSDIQAMLALSQTLRAKGDLERAAEVIQQALRSHGHSAQLFFALGEVYTAMGQGDRATEAYRMYAELRSAPTPAGRS